MPPQVTPARAAGRRLDLELVTRGLARSRSHARQLIDAGRVRADDRPATRPALLVRPGTSIAVDTDPYVSRAAHKLLGALDDLARHRPLPTGTGWRALDAGASTGGFTQVLLERGAGTVHAVDVGHDQLAPALRRDPRVRVHEGTNLRDLDAAVLDGATVSVVVADVSFISLTKVLAPLLAVLDPAGTALVMVKPQFEVGRGGLDKHGLVRSPTDRARAVAGVVTAARDLGWVDVATAPSRVPGPAGNIEFFVLLRRHP